ncbi:MAG: efflux RND transporter permease subunit [Gemmatimonadetes bacterium]|nr:efflux RND transporter permease subunit [Gemmatimonadota bacterium]
MILSDTAIKRPVFTTMLVVSMLLFGYLGIRSMGIDQFPKIDFPYVTVTTILPGASPDITEADVTRPIEEQLNTIEGVKQITSTSALGVSQILVQFELNRNVDVAAQDVRDKVALARANLPTEAEDPLVQKLDINAQPVVWVALTGLDVKTMSVFANEVLKPRLQTLEGVGNVQLAGYRAREMRIWLDRAKLRTRSLTATDVIHAIQSKNVELPAGILESPGNEFRVNVHGQLDTPDQFDDMVIAYQDGRAIRLRDVGYAEDGLEPRRGLARFNGVPSVGLGVAPRPGANTVAVADLVKGQLANIQADLPPGMHVTVASDQSNMIRNSIVGARDELILGALLAVLVVFIFLRSWRSTLVIAATIPTSLVATFGMMRVLGFTINNITMLSLSLCVGIVVDDAIVVLENIFHYIEQGRPSPDAASFGTSEIFFAALAATLSIVAVFIPVAITQGLVGRFLFQFGVTVAIAVLFSLFVALTLTPMLSARILRLSTKRGRVHRALDVALDSIDAGYRWLLDYALDHRLVIVFAALGTFAAALVMGMFIPREFLSNVDQGEFTVRIKAPIGSSLDYTNRYLRQAEHMMMSDSAVTGVFSTIGLGGTAGVNDGQMVVTLVDASQRKRTQDEIMTEYRQKLNTIPGIQAYVERSSGVGGGMRNTPIQLVLKGGDLQQLAQTGQAVVDSLKRIPGLVDVDYDLQLQQPEVNVAVNRDVAAALGVSALDVSQTVNAMVGGLKVSNFKSNGQRYDVRVRALRSQRATPSDLDQLSTRSATGSIVSLANVVKVSEGTGVTAIPRLDQERATTIFADLDPSLPLGTGLSEALTAAQHIAPPGIKVAVTGQSQMFEESFQSLIFAIELSIIIIYIVLAVQFEHFLHPFTLMFALPLAISGAFGLMLITGTRLGIIGMIGMILLMGIVMKNSILLIDLTNKRREAGLGIYEALKEACPRRLRPILMTSAAITFGAIPVATQLMSGSQMRAPLAVVVIGGIFSSTLLTLVVVPVVYTYMDAVPGLLRRIFGGARAPVGGGER